MPRLLSLGVVPVWRLCHRTAPSRRCLRCMCCTAIGTACVLVGACCVLCFLAALVMTLITAACVVGGEPQPERGANGLGSRADENQGHERMQRWQEAPTTVLEGADMFPTDLERDTHVSRSTPQALVQRSAHAAPSALAFSRRPVAENRAECEDHEFEDVGGGDSLKMALRRWREREEERERGKDKDKGLLRFSDLGLLGPDGGLDERGGRPG